MTASRPSPPSIPRRNKLVRALVTGLAAAVSFALPVSRAHAGDGAYGRLDGDLDLGLAVGGAYTSNAPALLARVTATYVATAGLYAVYADALGSSGARIDRSFTAGITLKPLFWARFANAWETGPPRFDLFLDSFVFEIGALWSAPHGRALDARPGLEVAAGLGFPIFSDATGPFVEVRAALRYRREDLDGTGRSDIFDRGAILSVALAWHHIVSVHIADAGDRAVR